MVFLSVYQQPGVSLKSRRNYERRSAEAAQNPGVVPVSYKRQSYLSPLYNEASSLSYLDQLFNSITKIGRGSFGDVFAAISKEDSRPYALKITNDDTAIMDVLEVARLEKVPENPFCVKFVKAWKEVSRLFIQMELCLASLDKVLKIHLSLPEAQCWDILCDVASGLKYLHDKQLIHLDIKPANVMATANGSYKIGDFGLLIDLEEFDASASDSKLMVSEGDGKYVALELLCERVYTFAADIFSLGLLIVEVSSGANLPTFGTNWKAIRHGELPPCFNSAELSDGFRQLIKNMIQLEFQSRPTADEILSNNMVACSCQKYQTGTRINYMANFSVLWHERFGGGEVNGLYMPFLQLQLATPSPEHEDIQPVQFETPRRVPINSSTNGTMGVTVADRAARFGAATRRLFHD